MLGEDYIYISGNEFTPTSFGYELQAIEEVMQSEAGTELVNIQRLDKHVFTASWEGIDSDLLDVIEGLCQLPTVDMWYRNNVYTVRARGAAPSLINKSYKYSRSDGLWNVSVTFTEI